MKTSAIGHRVCFFGDSLVNGVRDGEKGGWPMRLGRRLMSDAGREITIYNLGIRAETTTALKDRWQREAESRMVPEFPGVLVFSFGVNDARHAEERGEETTMQVAPGISAANAHAIIATATKLAPTLWVGPQAVINGSKSSRTINDRLEGLNQIFAETAVSLDVPYLDLFSITRNEDDPWQRALRRGDGYHPDGGGYDRVADLIWDWSGWRDIFLPG